MLGLGISLPWWHLRARYPRFYRWAAFARSFGHAGPEILDVVRPTIWWPILAGVFTGGVDFPPLSSGAGHFPAPGSDASFPKWKSTDTVRGCAKGAVSDLTPTKHEPSGERNPKRSVTADGRNPDQGAALASTATPMYPGGQGSPKGSPATVSLDTPPTEGVIGDSKSDSGTIEELLEAFSDDARERCATKSDDAEVPVHLWDKQLVTTYPRALGQEEKDGVLALARRLQPLLLRVWRRMLWREWRAHRKLGFEKKDPNDTGEKGGMSYAEVRKHVYEKLGTHVEEGRDLLRVIGECNWWEWTGGSMLFSWRWPAEYQARAEEGLEVSLIGPPPSNKRPQDKERDPEIAAKVKRKIDKVRRRGYMKPGQIASLMSFFSVPKGQDDIRVVYNGTSSGLNDACWVPRFVLPTIETHLRQTGPGSWMGDADIGEMFLNFPLHRLMQLLCGVDLTQYGEKGAEKHWERWTWAAMGLKSSPYQCTQGIGYALEVLQGD